ncbi:MAG: segregation/condensation protein A [Actinobacteria bacterium]|nr:segregation/condensation protein A [Actinomycetota bacterium]
MSVKVSTSVYEGPFDLLLHLILKEEVELYEVRLSTIVDEFIDELGRLEGLDLEVATEFLLIAAILVELKTRRLLPGNNDLDLDEELAAWEERDLLLARLLECKTFKDAAIVLRRLSAAACLSRPRRMGPDNHFIDMTPDLLEGVTPDDLHRAFLRAFEPRTVERIDTFHIAPIRVSVADAVTELVATLPTSGPTTFRRMTGHLDEQLEVVVRFLAVLELYKQGVIDIDQVDTFGDIHVRWKPGAEPADVELVDAYEG